MTISTIGAAATTALPDTRPVLQGIPTASPSSAEAPAERSATQADAFGLKVLRSEIREILSMRLKLKFSSSGYESRVTAGQVARESLSAASWLLRESPLESADGLRRLRGDIASAGNNARQMLSEGERDDVDDALTRIDRGLADLDRDASRNRSASASVLDAQTRLSQRSTVRIRTQDGDIVTLKLRQRDAMSLESESKDGFSVIELEASSRSRMELKVRGDLDEGELEAIKAVFERASEIAKNFFGGDLAAAFEKAASLEFDQSELAKVSMKFRAEMQSRIRYADVVPYPVLEPGEPSAEPTAPPRLPSDPLPEAPAPVKATPEAVADTAAADAAPPGLPVAEQPATVADTSASDDAGNAIEAFVVQLKSFLQSTMLGFEKSDGQRYFYPESFKLTLLKSVLMTAAPQGEEAAAERAGTVVDAIALEDRASD